MFVPATSPLRCLHRGALDPTNRRGGPPFINCTPVRATRFDRARHAYDRERRAWPVSHVVRAASVSTTLPSDRPFSRSTIACNECGPQLRVARCAGNLRELRDAISCLAEALLAGQIAAVKGIGGCPFDLRRDARLRWSSACGGARGASKPLALMVASLQQAERWVELGPSAQEALRSSARPIVLAARRDGDRLPESIAPKVGLLGLMLPYTPLHHLLFRALHGRGHDGPLIVTSGNRNGSLIATSDREALERFGIADPTSHKTADRVADEERRARHPC